MPRTMAATEAIAGNTNHHAAPFTIQAERDNPYGASKRAAEDHLRAYADASGAVSVNLLTGLVTGASGEDSLVGIESVIGSRFNDNLVGDSQANELSGGAGNDVLEGGAGDDTLIGGSGIDLLTGGEGDDVYEVDVTGDVIVEREGEGTDLVNVRLTSGSSLGLCTSITSPSLLVTM